MELFPQFQIHVHELGNEPDPDPAGDIAGTGTVPRQSQFQYHVSGTSSATVAGEGAPLVLDAPLGGDVEGGFSGAAGVERGATAPAATFTWDTGPLSPGLSIRTLTLMFAAAGAGNGAGVGAADGFG